MGLRLMTWTLASLTLPALVHAGEVSTCSSPDRVLRPYSLGAEDSSNRTAGLGVPVVVAGLLIDSDADKNQFDDCCLAKLPCCRNSQSKF